MDQRFKLADATGAEHYHGCYRVFHFCLCVLHFDVYKNAFSRFQAIPTIVVVDHIDRAVPAL